MKSGKDLLRKILFSAVLAPVLVGLLLTTATYGKGKNKMERLYNDVKDAQVLTPQAFRIDKSISVSLFPVPQYNAVGTNDYKNAITIFSFRKGKMEMDHYFKREVASLSGGGEYLPVISPDLIGFGQMRRFVLFDFKNKKHEQYGIAFSMDKTIFKIAIADAEKRRFLFEIKEYNRHSENPSDSTYFLNLIDLGEKKVNLIKKVEIGKGSTWSSAHNKVFLWFFKKKEIQVYDMNLEPSNHALADFIRKNKNRLDFTRMVPHPYLPFAILLGGQQGATYISWEEDRIKGPQPLLSVASVFSFSPDGKWVSFQKDNLEKDRKETFIMPVSEKYPYYLGTPILLSDKYFDEGYFAWTTNPIGFVGSDDKIYHWELTNEAHPESDKPTFHDYIVEKDLERLAKEKKQGLGKEK